MFRPLELQKVPAGLGPAPTMWYNQGLRDRGALGRGGKSRKSRSAPISQTAVSKSEFPKSSQGPDISATYEISPP